MNDGVYICAELNPPAYVSSPNNCPIKIYVTGGTIKEKIR